MICSRKSVSLALAVAAMVFSVTLASAEEKRHLVTSKIDDSVTTRLFGNTRPEVNALNDRGPVDKEMPMDHLQLMLQRPAELEAAAAKFVDELHDSNSPLFHKWVGAEEFGEKFGPADSDVDTVKDWLASQGLTVNFAYSNKMFIDFSGTAGQVETAFHTEIHNYEVKGKMYIANSRDPQVPAALAPAVRGVLYLNNFKPKAMNEKIHQVHVDPKSGTLVPQYDRGSKEKGGAAKSPQYDSPYGDEGIVPYDLAKIYNIQPLFSAGISGQGMKIVVVEDTNQWGCNGNVALSNAATGTPCNGTSDWTVFRNAFGLGRYTSGALLEENPGATEATTCTTPSTGSGYPKGSGINSDDVEASIDVQWATAAAPNATIVNAACADPRGGFGGLTAIENILNRPSADHVDVISMSYGESEEETGATLNAAFNTTFQEAAAAGIGIFVSSGDEDAASSDGGGEYECAGSEFPTSEGEYWACALQGISISGWMSSPYDVSVGGLDFADVALKVPTSEYWLPSNNVYYGSAKSYIMEQPWNDSCASTLFASFLGYPTTYGSSGFCNSATAIDAGDPSSNFLNSVGGSGGPSQCATGRDTTVGGLYPPAGGTCAGYAKPTYQSAYLGTMPGLANDKVRDTPDVALMAANGLWGHYYVICFSDTTTSGVESGGTSCTNPVSDWPGYGGTSVASPIFAAIQSLVVQKQGSLQGNPDTEYYKLANAEYSNAGSLASCNSANGNASGSSCIFHDVTLGDNDAPCQGFSVTSGKTTTNYDYNCYLGTGQAGILSTSTTSPLPAYLATPGWDFTSGIGSVNAYNLVMGYNK